MFEGKTTSQPWLIPISKLANMIFAILKNNRNSQVQCCTTLNTSSNRDIYCNGTIFQNITLFFWNQTYPKFSKNIITQQKQQNQTFEKSSSQHMSFVLQHQRWPSFVQAVEPERCELAPTPLVLAEKLKRKKERTSFDDQLGIRYVFFLNIFQTYHFWEKYGNKNSWMLNG